ncbi:hypothetical protein M426DRAFT_256446, partial [Hypoxylon sp. CI-4A]
MSGEPYSGEGSYPYGFPSRPQYNGYHQEDIGYTSSFVTDHVHSFPHPNPLHNANQGRHGGGLYMNQLNDEHGNDQGLDNFDRDPLGRPQTFILHQQSPEYQNQRLSLPHTGTPYQPRRVVGDASHHFRPSTTQEQDYNAFSAIPTHLGRIEPSPASQPVFSSRRPHRIRELQPVAQTLTPPLYTAPDPVSTVEDPLTSSSPSNIGGSSPSTRLSLKQQAKSSGIALIAQKKAANLKWDLEHAPNETPIINGIRLVDPRKELPDKCRLVFPYELFNAVQSKCFPVVHGTNDNAVISAPTGSGKTAILEMAICKIAMSPNSENSKIVYLAPTKSLCSERAQDWEKKFSHMNLRCAELTGDTSQVQASRVGSASIIVTTPEKWDSITRKWSDHRKLLEMIRLVLIDEVHILKDTRGATLEAVVSRMKTIGANVRFVALSATVPNIGDVAKWLGRDHANQREPARTEAFGEEMRPVKLQRYVYGFKYPGNDFIFDKSLNGNIKKLLTKHSEGKPIMIFCFTRKSCEITAKFLAEWWSSCGKRDIPWPAPTKRINLMNGELQDIVQYGVAYHHAGLGPGERSAIAKNFLEGQIRVICCTSTLAVGVNLPCHTVIVKGTTGYSNDNLQEYSDLEVMQMLGRAGRPQFDDSAVAIIMTRMENVDRYKKMMSGAETLESTLHQNLVEHLNSEISLGTIQDVQTAKKWIGGTFLSVRVRQSPALYHLEDVRNSKDADARMEEWCERDVQLLQQYELVTEQAPLKCTEYGHAMSRYMVDFETMRQLLSVPRGANLNDILTTLCQAVEFKDFRFKNDERAVFREMNKSPFISHQIKEPVTQTWHKVFLMVQICLGGVEWPNEKGAGFLRQRMATEKNVIFDRLNRLVRCFVDCRAFDSDGSCTNAGLELARALAANSWEDKPSQLSQVPGIGPVMVRKWVSHGVSTVLDLANRDFTEIERVASRNPPYGMHLLKSLENFPRLVMKVDLDKPTGRQSRGEDGVKVTLRVKLHYTNTKTAPAWRGRVPAVTFIVLTTDGNLAYFWRGNLRNIDKSIGINLKFPVALSGANEKISCQFSCEEIVGTRVTKVLEPKIPQAAFKDLKKRQAPATNPLDDEIDYDDLLDEDMLDASLSAISPEEEVEPLDFPGSSDTAEEEFPLIDNLLSQDKEPSASEPMKMDNGKWMCNHRCRNGNLTTSGKPCTHKCCHEGLDKPRPPPQGKKKNKNNVSEGDDKSNENPSVVG